MTIETTRIEPGTPTITLYRMNGLWFALHGGNGAADVRRMFGTDTLPTPYSAELDADTVLDAVAALNPSKLVLIEAGE